MVPCPPDPGHFPHTDGEGHEGRVGSRGIPELGPQDTAGQGLVRAVQHQDGATQACTPWLCTPIYTPRPAPLQDCTPPPVPPGSAPPRPAPLGLCPAHQHVLSPAILRGVPNRCVGVGPGPAILWAARLRLHWLVGPQVSPQHSEEGAEGRWAGRGCRPPPTAAWDPPSGPSSSACVVPTKLTHGQAWRYPPSSRGGPSGHTQALLGGGEQTLELTDHRAMQTGLRWPRDRGCAQEHLRGKPRAPALHSA